MKLDEKMIGVRITGAEFLGVKRVAGMRGISVSAWVREAANAALERDGDALRLSPPRRMPRGKSAKKRSKTEAAR